MESVLLVIHIVVCVALVGSILLQQNSGDGLSGIGGGGGGGNSLMSGRASSNFLTRVTSILATIFILNSLLLAIIASHSTRGGSTVDSILPTNAAPAPAPEAEKPAAPAKPKSAVPLAR